MHIEIETSDPDNVDPKEIAEAVEAKGYFVLDVSVNDGERTWSNPELEDEEPDGAPREQWEVTEGGGEPDYDPSGLLGGAKR